MSFILTPKNKFLLSRKNLAKTLPSEREGRAAALYRGGAIDAEIAIACNCTKNAVMEWRRRTGRASNYEKRREFYE